MTKNIMFVNTFLYFGAVFLWFFNSIFKLDFSKSIDYYYNKKVSIKWRLILFISAFLFSGTLYVLNEVINKLFNI